MAWLGDATHLPFNVAVKLPGTLADLVIVVLLFEHVRSREGWTGKALLPAALFALNPVPALISAAHGQFDALPVLFSLLAFHLRLREGKGALEFAALALGVGIALKAYPALLLPYLALTAPSGRKVWTFAVALIPVGVASAVYVVAAGYSSAMVTHVIGYPSTAAMGWVLFTQYVHLPLPVLVAVWLGSDVAIIAFATLVPWLALRKFVVNGASSVFAFFYAVVFRASVQYLVWGLPFFCLVSWLGTVVYSAAATTMLLGYYATDDQLALPTGLPAVVITWLQAAYDVRAALVILSGALLVGLSLANRRRVVAYPMFRTTSTEPIAP